MVEDRAKSKPGVTVARTAEKYCPLPPAGFGGGIVGESELLLPQDLGLPSSSASRLPRDRRD